MERKNAQKMKETQKNDSTFVEYMFYLQIFHFKS